MWLFFLDNIRMKRGPVMYPEAGPGSSVIAGPSAPFDWTTTRLTLLVWSEEWKQCAASFSQLCLVFPKVLQNPPEFSDLTCYLLSMLLLWIILESTDPIRYTRKEELRKEKAQSSSQLPFYRSQWVELFCLGLQFTEAIPHRFHGPQPSK